MTAADAGYRQKKLVTVVTVWLLALSTSSCELKLDDEAVRVVPRLGLDLCIPYLCRCGVQVDVRGLHGFGRAARHHALNGMLIEIGLSAVYGFSVRP